jgi:hypothetical protein
MLLDLIYRTLPHYLRLSKSNFRCHCLLDWPGYEMIGPTMNHGHKELGKKGII